MAYVNYLLTGSKTTFTTAFSLLRLVLPNLTLKPLLVEYHRDQLKVLYCSYFISMIYLTAQKNYPSVYLPTIQICFFPSDNLYHLESIMNEELNLVFKYCNINKLSINFTKTTYKINNKLAKINSNYSQITIIFCRSSYTETVILFFHLSIPILSNHNLGQCM